MAGATIDRQPSNRHRHRVAFEPGANDETELNFYSVWLLSLHERKTEQRDFWLLFGWFIFCLAGAQCCSPLSEGHKFEPARLLMTQI